MPITLLDGILVGFTLVSAMLAMVRGFSREVLSVVSWAAAAAAAFFFYKPLLPYIQPHIDNDKIAMAASAGIVFIVALIVVSVITMKLADWIIDSRIGALDRTLGFLYGAARGAARHLLPGGKLAVLRCNTLQRNERAPGRRRFRRRPAA